MSKIEERKKIWCIFYSPLSFIILLVIFVFMARAFWSVYQHEQISSKDRARIEADLASAQVRSALLKDQVKSLETPQGVDAEIRSKFNVSKVGEGVAIIVGVTDTSSTPTTTVQSGTFWQRFLGVFGL